MLPLLYKNGDCRQKVKEIIKIVHLANVCVCVCVYVRVCVHKHARMHTWVCTWVCLCAVAWVHVLAWAHVLVCALAHISVCVCVCVCMRVCVCWPFRLCILSLFWKHHQCSSLRHVSFNFCFLKHILSNPAMMSPHSDVWTIPSESQHPTQVHTRAHTHTHTHTRCIISKKYFSPTASFHSCKRIAKERSRDLEG